MDLDLTGRTALVTASTSGIGLATACGLAACGARVWMNGRSPERLERARTTVVEHVPGADVDTVVGDVATRDGVRAVTDTVTDLDILVPMAGGTANLVPFVELSDDDWQYQWDYNVMQGVRLARHYVPLLLTKDFGRIVFLSSTVGYVTPPDVVDYRVAKAAVIRLSRCVAEIFSGTNVTVNCVVPGPTKSDWVYRMADGRPLADVEAEYFPTREPTSLLERFAEAEDVANLIVYLCSPASAATRGAVLRADGGSVRAG